MGLLFFSCMSKGASMILMYSDRGFLNIGELTLASVLPRCKTFFLSDGATQKSNSSDVQISFLPLIIVNEMILVNELFKRQEGVDSNTTWQTPQPDTLFPYRSF
mgnify:CR=1 FL=1